LNQIHHGQWQNFDIGTWSTPDVDQSLFDVNNRADFDQ
jgi:hypothetical protein